MPGDWLRSKLIRLHLWGVKETWLTWGYRYMMSIDAGYLCTYTNALKKASKKKNFRFWKMALFSLDQGENGRQRSFPVCGHPPSASTSLKPRSPGLWPLLAIQNQSVPPLIVSFLRLVSALFGCLRIALAEAFNLRVSRRAAYSYHTTCLALGQYHQTKLLAATEKKQFA